jgi:hypothetical protein
MGPRDILRCASAALAAFLLAASGAPLAAATDRPLQSVVADLQPVAGTPDVTFVVSGDNRPTAKGAPQPRLLRTIFDEIGLLRPDLVLWSGDTIYGYCDTAAELDAEYDGFVEAARRGGVPLFNAPGNHEIHPGETCLPASAPPCDPKCLQEGFSRRFGPVYGSFDYAGVHFISLDTEFPGQEDSIDGDQLDWLQRDLEKNKGARAIFVFCHTQFYTSPLIDADEGPDHQSLHNRAALHDLFRRYPVRGIFTGHEHLYWHAPPEQHDFLDYFIAAGGGAPAYAPPERGGFAHYVLVRISGEKVSYDVIEPGRLYVEPGVAKGPAEARVWLVNNTHVGGLALRGIDVEVPASLGGCADLTVTTELRRWNGQLRPVPIETLSCTPGATVTRLRLRATNVPQGSSVPVVIRNQRAQANQPAQTGQPGNSGSSGKPGNPGNPEKQQPSGGGGAVPP